MRKDSFGVGDLLHVYNRGNRKQEIVRDDLDCWRFLQMLYYFNDEFVDPNLWHTLSKFDFDKKLKRPSDWPEKDPLVHVVAFVLMNNHFHLVLQEIKEGGVTRFMRKLGTGMTNRFNTRYEETGRLFQGSYKARRIGQDRYLQYLAVYIHIKNVFELYPGGFDAALKNFDEAFEFAVQYPYSSLGGYVFDSHVTYPVTEKGMMQAVIKSKNDFRELAKNCIDFVYFDEKHNLIEV